MRIAITKTVLYDETIYRKAGTITGRQFLESLKAELEPAGRDPVIRPHKNGHVLYAIVPFEKDADKKYILHN